MSGNPFLDQVRSSFQRSRPLNAGPSLQPSRVISEIQNRLERELATAKEQAIATFEGLAIHTDLPGSSPSNSESSSDQEEEEEMAANNDDNRALEDYAQPIIPDSPSCILLSIEARNYDLKSSHFHMLPSFYGLPNEDPLAHIKEFYNVVSGLPLQGVSEANPRMRAFPYTLKDKAKGWLMTLAPGSLTTWEAVAKKFLEKFFSTQKTATREGKSSTINKMMENLSMNVGSVSRACCCNVHIMGYLFTYKCKFFMMD
ncbi:unnamed protein product [Prunus brigantina]